MARADTVDVQRASQRFIRKAMAAPLLTREREAALARAWAERRDEAALHELVGCHHRLVVSIVSQYRGYGLSFADLLQEGSLGLMQAAARFDAEREVRFSTYAVWWIRAAIQDFILRNWSVVRLGTTTSEKALFFNLRRLRARIAGASGGRMGVEERDQVAASLSVTEAQVEVMEARLSGADQSTNVTLGEDGETQWQDLLVDERPTPEQVVTELRDSATRSRWLARALGQLPEREERIIRQRHLGEGGVTLEELGQELGVSKERVRQLEQRALKALRRLITETAGAEARL
jgi:RNA polymerase sigma-32 factor